LRVPGLEILARSPDAGVAMVLDSGSQDVFILNHLEYDAETLAEEYARDREEGIPTAIPANYFPEDDPERSPANSWRPYAFLLIANWINDLYRTNPFELSTMSSATPNGQKTAVEK
jgi:homoserine O-succinyltransferase